MIVEGFFGVAIDGVKMFLGFLFAMVPSPPGFVQTGLDAVGQLWGSLYSFDTWLPITLTVTVVSAVIAMWLITLVLEATRMVISIFTFGGGAK